MSATKQKNTFAGMDFKPETRLEVAPEFPGESPAAEMARVQFEIKQRAIRKSQGFKDDNGGTWAVAPAVLVLVKIEKGEVKSGGGIFIPDGSTGTTGDGSKLHGANKFDQLVFGVVQMCGVYQQRDGTIVWDYPDWPLPPGTLICHENHNAMETSSRNFGKTVDVRDDQIRRWCLPGLWPEWALESPTLNAYPAIWDLSPVLAKQRPKR